MRPHSHTQTVPIGLLQNEGILQNMIMSNGGKIAAPQNVCPTEKRKIWFSYGYPDILGSFLKSRENLQNFQSSDPFARPAGLRCFSLAVRVSVLDASEGAKSVGDEEQNRP